MERNIRIAPNLTPGRRTLSLLLTVALVAAALLGAVGETTAQLEGNDPQQTVAFTELGTLRLPPVGKVVGLTWMGPDTLAVLMDVADTLTSSGERQMRLVFQDSAGVVFRDEDFSGVLDRALAWDGEFLWSCGDADDGSSILYKIGVDSLDVWQVDEEELVEAAPTAFTQQLDQPADALLNRHPLRVHLERDGRVDSSGDSLERVEQLEDTHFRQRRRSVR